MIRRLWRALRQADRVESLTADLETFVRLAAFYAKDASAVRVALMEAEAGQESGAHQARLIVAAIVKESGGVVEVSDRVLNSVESGRLLSTVDPLRSVTRFEYRAEGRPGVVRIEGKQ